MGNASKLCEDGRIWGQNNKESGLHLGILVENQNLIDKQKRKGRRAQYIKQYQPKYYELHKEEIKLKQKQYRQRMKVEVLSHYSLGDYPVCAKCGIADIDILCLDHINGDGAKQRRKNPTLGSGIYLYVKKSGFPKGLQVLCFNCNMKKRITEGK